MQFDIIIGIETHIQLNTASKMFCACSTNSWQAEPNTLTCPTCLGLPGALPVINKEGLDKAILVGLALNSRIANMAQFDRKNYFYPDLAKAYQITQYQHPIALGGHIEVDGQPIELIRAHLEEDVGKLSHQGNHSLVNFNKGGTPLLEIVSKPTIRSAAQAKAYVQKLRQIARYINVNDGNLERGSMRADVNISLQQPGRWQYQDDGLVGLDGYQLNNRVEVKNLNSFRAIERAVEYEVARQSELLQQGKSIDQETRGWDESKGKTIAQRNKEEAHDYRYFPEPDLPPLHIDQQWIDSIKTQLPEMADTKMARFMSEYGLSQYQARLLVEEKANADWFEQAVTATAQHMDAAMAATQVANWMLGEIARLQNQHQTEVYQSQLQPTALATMLELVHKQTISAANAKELVAELYQSGGDPKQMVKDKGMEQVSNDDQLAPVITQVIQDNPDAVAKIKDGKASTIQFLVGQVMKQTKGRANPGTVAQLLQKAIEELG